MKRPVLIFLSLLCLLSKKSVAQNTGCIDSITFNRFISPYFGLPASDPPVRDTADNIYINGFSYPPGEPNYNLTKFNANNELVWLKIFRTNPFTQIAPGSLRAIDGKANLIFGGSGNDTIISILKYDSAANFIWNKRLQRTDNPLITGAFGIYADINEDIYLSGTYTDDNKKNNIVKLDPSGNMLWSKKYGNTDLPKFHVLERLLISQNANTIVLFNHFFYDADLFNDPTAKHGLHIVKINKADGSIQLQKTFMYYNDATGTSQNFFTLKKVNYSAATGTFLIDNWGQVLPPFFRAHILTLLDNNLDPINTVLYNTTIINPGENINISKDNQLVITLNRPTIIFGFPENSLNYITINNNLDIIRQKKIDLANLTFPDYGFRADFAFKKNGFLNFQLMLGNATSTNNPIYLFDNSPFYQNINSPCSGKDTTIYTKGIMYALPVNNVTYADVADVAFSSTGLTPDPYVERIFPKNEICKEISICDTIKLFGSNYHCLSNPLDSFKIIRNPLCKRVTNWQVDTNYIKILSHTDTSLHVQYLQPYRGSIKVGFGGCSLTDQILIEVYAAKTGVNLGNDTMHCPGKTITLKAGKDFRTYLWQNGSNKDSLVATQPGMYNVIATDSCGNIFKDTVLINPFDAVLKTDHPKALCPGDTAIFILPNQLINYSWLPTTASSLNNYTWKLFPSATTTYSITGERLPGCTVSDTVLINVKPNCLPDYIYFPNAFTPDNNGLNDTYKPGFNGQLVLYELIIYNRYGQPVFKTTSPTEGWDGKFKNSSKPLAGSYVWMCKYQFAGRPVQHEQGTFILVK